MCEHCKNTEHGHEHHHGHEHPENDLMRVYVAAAIIVVAIVAPVNSVIDFVLFLVAYLIAGSDVIVSAAKNIIKGKVFDENFLMSIATIGAFCLKEFPEAVSVMILYQIGEFLQHRAVDKSRHSITDLMDIKVEYANVEEDGVLKHKKPGTLKIGDEIIVKTGEKVPVDGVITSGHSFIDTSSLTGESVLKEVKTGDEVLSGSVNTSGVLKMQVKREYKDSAVSKILELVENASSRKSKTENFITRFARYYTPVVVAGALLLIIIPVIIYGPGDIDVWVERALTFLVISCPCALVISVPLTFFSGIGAASKAGILIKGSNYLELLSTPDTIVFDKTGTLTKGVFKVSSVITMSTVLPENLIEYAAYAENYSNHPIAASIKEAYGKTIDSSKISDAQEIAGFGVKAKINNNEVLAGNLKFMKEAGCIVEKEINSGTVVYVAINRIYSGCIVISDELKENAVETIRKLKKYSVKTVMLTGDSEKNAQKAALDVNIDKYFAELLPDDKVRKLEEIISEKNANKSVIFVGDGINDAPVLMRSDAGIAMGALGSDAAIEAADIVITDDNLSKIYTAVNIAKRTMLIAKQNIVFAIGIKISFLILGTFGLMTMWGAVFADVGVTLLAVLNSLRMLKVKNYS